MKKYRPTSVIVAWDGKVPKFRRQLVPEYKANRHADEDPEVRADFYRQMDELHNYALPRMGIMSVRKNYIEADDLLYHASVISWHDENIIVTADKDLLQAISVTTKVLNPAKNKLYGVSEFEEEFGFELSKFVWWKSLQGDGSDNVPGVDKVGEVTAVKLIKEHESILSMFSDIETGKFTGKISEHVRDFGYERLVKNYKVMNLSEDRTGARFLMYNELEYYMSCNRDVLKRYFLRNAFVSLLDSLPKMCSDLTCPKFNMFVRYPIVEIERTPVEDI
jgi:5'-3' exonuclease